MDQGGHRSGFKMKGAQNKFKKNDGKCFICKEEGHWRNECPKARNNEGTAMIAESKANLVTSTN